MKLSYIAEDRLSRYDKQLEVVSKKLDIDKDELIYQLRQIDRSMKYWPWILKQIKFENIIWPEDNHRVWQTLQDFKNNKNRLQHRDINRYKRIQDLENELARLTPESTGSGRYKFDPQTLPGVELIDEDGEYKLYQVHNAESLAKMGVGTKWCTREDYPSCAAHDYLSKHNYLYIITKNNAPYIQATPDLSQVMDKNDEPINTKFPFSQRIMNLEDISDIFTAIKYADDDEKNKIIDYIANIDDKHERNKYIIEFARATSERSRDLEKLITTPHTALEYARGVNKPVPELEEIILQDTDLALRYAYYPLNGRWPELEEILLNQKNPKDVLRYVTSIRIPDWEEGNKIIAQDPESAIQFAKYFEKRLPEAEPKFSPLQALNYSIALHDFTWPGALDKIMRDYDIDDIVVYLLGIGKKERLELFKKYPKLGIAFYAEHRARDKEFEKFIHDNPKLALLYSVKTRRLFPDAEPHIKKHPNLAYLYAKSHDIRFEDAEPYIRKNKKIWRKYQEFLENH